MNEVVKILKLVVKILIYPKEISRSKTLVEYNTKMISLLSFFMFFIQSCLWYFFRAEIQGIPVLVILVVAPIIVYFVSIRYGVMVFKAIIKSVVNFDIPHNNFKKIVLPYIFTSQIIALIVFGINKSSNEVISALPIIWFTIQIFLIAKYRICNREMTKAESLEIATKLFIFLLVLFLLQAII